MKKVVWMVLCVLLSMGLMTNEVSAKRFGGVRSFNSYRSKNYSSKNVSAPKTSTAGKASRWRSGLSGFLLGGLLASLFFHNGLGTALFSWLLLGAVVLIALRFLTRFGHQGNGKQ
ncbi:transmembrane protein [Legionella birminghamensis]|uniref:Transmembrane protein n=1 Tax=Legionella birminghamensis TaxID=28083 RepID=A0A378I9M7_9GAMM|nr:hypothetical protein [Legionella birminghamensis]KTC67970.1 transmembrane protein [Legionella birminghamensis]STX31321.1 transmembrane protein [Legionella birminghamensis]